nr:angiotensin-converting enzyme-like [Onthophagus taurus]
MTAIYGKAKVCPFTKQKCNLKTEGLSQDDLDFIMANSTNLEELGYLWQAWRIATGRKVKKSFNDYVKLKNQAAVLNGFKDEGDFWRYDYEIPNMEKVMEELWLSLEPLYLQLHTYVLRKLSAFYGKKINVKDGLLPAHITGNNYAQSWEYLNKIVKPFPNAEEIDVTKILKSKNFTILKLFETANEFYTSMGLDDMSMAYGPKAMLDKIENREVVCHASAWDMCDPPDYRISMCTEINKENFRVIHHELGHIQYYIQYSKQLYSFRNSANAGFHEAIGDSIVLSVMNPDHLKKIGLIDSNYKSSYESNINYLMEQALEDIPNFPFTYLVDRWRWDVFKGKTKLDEINNLWWFYRKNVQKVKPPIPRGPLDFDPGSKFHIIGDTEYMPYFIANVIKFQIYKGLCIAAGEFDPNKKKKSLFECDFYGSKIAGEKMKMGLQVGSSIHWSKTLQMMSGQSTMNTSAIYDYFEPLINYLKAENLKFSK